MDGPASQAQELKGFVTYRLARLQSQLNAQAIRLLKRHSDLSLTEWRVLAVTAGLGTCTLSDLSRDTGMDKGQLSRAVSSLVRRADLHSEMNESDHRQNLLRLTDTGLKLHARILPIMRARQVHLTQGIDPGALDAALRVLDQLEEAARRTPGE